MITRASLLCLALFACALGIARIAVYADDICNSYAVKVACPGITGYSCKDFTNDPDCNKTLETKIFINYFECKYKEMEDGNICSAIKNPDGSAFTQRCWEDYTCKLDTFNNCKVGVFWDHQNAPIYETLACMK